MPTFWSYRPRWSIRPPWTMAGTLLTGTLDSKTASSGFTPSTGEIGGTGGVMSGAGSISAPSKTRLVREAARLKARDLRGQATGHLENIVRLNTLFIAQVASV